MRLFDFRGAPATIAKGKSQPVDLG